MNKALRFIFALLILASASVAWAQNEEVTHRRVSATGTLASSDVYSIEGAFHYMFFPYLGVGGAFGYWANYFDDGWASGRGWHIDDDDNKPSNLYLRPSLILKTPSVRIKATHWSLYAEPSVMLNIPYQRVCIEKTDHWHVVDYDYISTGKGQWFAAELRVGLSAQIGPCGITAGYLMSNFDIYSQYRHLKYHGESFEKFYPRKSFMQGAFLSLSYDF